uniref:Uncharacterized protein n=1 Tax=Anguilla anguilla TaxID=7936 RepID=A0A0E9Q6E7_ANGAN
MLCHTFEWSKQPFAQQFSSSLKA